MKEMRNAYKSYFENLKGRDHLEEPGINGRLILKLILKKHDEIWAGINCLMVVSSGRLLWTR
jgi:hypothetical protein